MRADIARFILIAFAFIFGTTTAPEFASAQGTETTSTSSFELPLTSGHWLVDGGFQVTKYDDTMQTFLYPSAEYFVLDGLSVGAAAVFSWSDDSTYTSLGPSAHYYFLSSGRWAPFVHQIFYFSKYDGASKWRTEASTALGVSYFFNDSVAFSPMIRGSYGNERRGSGDLIGAFTIIL